MLFPETLESSPARPDFKFARQFNLWPTEISIDAIEDGGIQLDSEVRAWLGLRLRLMPVPGSTAQPGPRTRRRVTSRGSLNF